MLKFFKEKIDKPSRDLDLLINSEQFEIDWSRGTVKIKDAMHMIEVDMETIRQIAREIETK